MKKLTVGILAHVDSGKTTLSEALLYACGAIRKLGRVDHADTFLDTDPLERKRGITIFSKQAVIQSENYEITLLDTPGHVDFSPEAERTLSVLDAAILVISGIDGVQSHTETLWKLLSKHGVPVFIFVNKMDIKSADRETLLSGLKKKLSSACIPADGFSDGEELAMCDEALMEKFLDGKEISEKDIRKLIRERKLFPCYFGSALKSEGVSEFLSGLDKYVTCPDRKEKFGARIYKISRDENGKRLTHMKITGGKLCAKDMLCGTDSDGNEWNEKADEIRIYSGTKYTTVTEAVSGTVCAVTGLEKTSSGDGLGFETEKESPVLEPVFSYRVILPKSIDTTAAYRKIKTLEEEEPLLHVKYNESAQEITLLLMGQVQLEIIGHLITARCGFDVSFGEGSVVYHETVLDTVEGVGHYEPLRHYAEVHVIIEPLPRGSGIDAVCDCPTEMLERNYQNLVLTHIEEKTHIGVLTGSALTDVRITLVAGRAHKKHTEGGDFRQATYRAIRQGLMKAKCALLEPFYDYELKVPDALVGRAMSDIVRMGGTVGSPESDGEYSTVRGVCPVCEMQLYGLEVADYSHGKGTLFCSFKGYDLCHNEEEVIAKYGYDPNADPYNSCDSVFCANGAGFLVKWDEVEKYMHLESVLGKPKTTEEQLEIKRLAANYVARAATDKELMEIFERTYGPIRKRDAGKIKVEAKTNDGAANKKPSKPKITYTGEEYLLIDGYNIIFAWDDLKKTAILSLELARSELINRLCNYQGFCGINIILVFDAYKVKKNPGTVENFRNISVVYTKEAETADAYIERTSHELSKNNRVRVATSDGPEQMIILGNGALRVPAAAFRKELTDAENEIRSLL